MKFVPQPPPPSREPIAVYLCIDRSNSMSYDSRYPAVRDGERIRYAKQAAIALLRQLDDTDFAGVIAFDSQPYVLAHLQPLGEDRTELENRIERLAARRRHRLQGRARNRRARNSRRAAFRCAR